MSAPNTITIAGNLTADPEMTTTSSELDKTKLRVAVSRRIFVPESSTWEDRHDGYFTVICWREMARSVDRSLRKGDRVVITGRLSRRQFEVTTGEDGATESRHVYEIDAEEIGASLRWDIWTRQIRPKRAGAEAPHPATAAVADGSSPSAAPAATADEQDVTAAA